MGRPVILAFLKYHYSSDTPQLPLTQGMVHRGQDDRRYRLDGGLQPVFRNDN